MNIYVYSDESGVFDVTHYDYYVFGGIIILGNDKRIEINNKYIAAERAISYKYENGVELKATKISNADKDKLFRSMNNVYKFGIIVDQNKVNKEYFNEPKTKQRYLDYVYKMGIKSALNKMISSNIIDKREPINMYFNIDEHATATDGRYELRESLLNEFKYGASNFATQSYFPPLFKNLNSLDLRFCDSKRVPLVRAADIIANKVYYCAVNGYEDKIHKINNISISCQP